MRFEDLEVWKRAARLSADIYIELRELKDFGFRDQITRAGLSVPSNIAEPSVPMKVRHLPLDKLM